MALAMRLRVVHLAALVAVAMVCAGCSTSSPAAMVNGHPVAESQLDQLLEGIASDKAYVTAFDTEQKDEVEQEQEQAEASGGNPDDYEAITVQGTGSGQDNYSLDWVTIELNNLIQSDAIHQYLQRRHQTPTATELASAFAAEDAVEPPVWEQLTPQARSFFTRFDAEHALIEPKVLTAKSDKQFYSKYRSYFWSQVCLSEVDVSVAGRNGLVNMATSKQRAEAEAKSMESSGAASGARYCLSPEQLTERPSNFASTVRALAPGKAAAIAGHSGYQAVEVTSRTVVPFNSQSERVIDVMVNFGGSRGTGQGDTALISLLSKDKVQVNMRYGEWVASPPAATNNSTGKSEPTPPRVFPPDEIVNT